MKKKAIILAGAVVMVSALLMGCQKQSIVPEANGGQTEEVVATSEQTVQEPEATVEPEVTVEPEQMVGGWAVCESNNSRLLDDEQKIFDEAMAEMQGLDYQGLAVIATQVVSGTNRAYLAFGGEKDQPKGYAVIVVYTNLQGESVMNSLAVIDPTDLHIKEATGDKLLGGWEGVTSGKAWMLPSEEAQASFETLFLADENDMRNPIALLDTQIVSGVNYLAMDVDKQGNVYLSKWYKNLEGNAEVLEDGVLDMDYYTQNH